jgi:hypothetical protein
MAQKPMLRTEVYARALRVSQNLKGSEVYTESAEMIGQVLGAARVEAENTNCPQGPQVF